MQTIRFTEHTKEDQFCISIWYSCSSVDIKADLFFLLWQKCQKFSNFKIRVCAVHSIGIRNVKLGFAAMLTNTICSGVYGNQVKNRKILWRNQHILRDLINLFVENVNCKVIFSTMKLDMRAKNGHHLLL